MQLIATIVFIILLLTVVVCDFKYMAIPLYLLLLTIIAAMIRLFLSNAFKPALLFTGINMLGCSAIILFSVLTLFLLKKKLFNPLHTHIGAGDLMIFPVLCVSFSPLNFLFFFVLTLALTIFIKPVFFRKTKTLPLAGCVSFFLVIVLIASELLAFDVYNDNDVLRFILPQ